MRLATRFLLIVAAASHIGAACSYSPPPLLNLGQGADTVGKGGLAIAGEGGFGAAGSWAKATRIGSPDVNTGFTGAVRARVGAADDIDLGVVGGLGPENAFVAGPEMKWRFAHLSESDADDAPAFHAALLAGTGVGASDYRYGPQPRRWAYVAPYGGIMASGGIKTIQMFTGLKLAGSETIGNRRTDTTLYPVLGFGVKVNIDPRFNIYAEGDLAGGVTLTDVGDSSIIGYTTVGVSVLFERLFR